MPTLGFGVYQIPPEQTKQTERAEQAEQAVIDTLTACCRSLDTSAAHGNEASVVRAINSSGNPAPTPRRNDDDNMEQL